MLNLLFDTVCIRKFIDLWPETFNTFDVINKFEKFADIILQVGVCYLYCLG